MIWAAIGLDVRTPLIYMTRDSEASNEGFTAKSYIEALEEGLIPIYQAGQVFQQDNARIHTAKVTQEWFERHGIWVIDWPPYSPDLNPIEHAWKALKHQLYALFPDNYTLRNNSTDMAELRRRLDIAWEHIDQVRLRHLMESIPRRLKACRRARGWYTKY